METGCLVLLQSESAESPPLLVYYHFFPLYSHAAFALFIPIAAVFSSS